MPASASPGPVAVITGAGSGIGRAVAVAMLDAGYRVALAGRRRETLEETAGARAEALAVPTDVTDEAAVDALFAATTKAFGRVDVLFNNAGAFGPGALVGDYPVGAWREVVEVNLTGAFLCARRAFAVMREQDPQGGRIINNGSISAHTPRPQAVAYTATKHAMTGLTKAIALDGRTLGIACGQIDIGNAATDMTAAMQGGVLQADGSTAAEATMDVGHAAAAVVHMAELPLDANVEFLTIMATRMPFVGRG
jgi:NAD(P)-dependent dehydrogenase (short-subunit alcohol dehydrogenase family)